MPRLVQTAQWEAEEEPSALIKRPHVREIVVVRPSLPPVVLDGGGQVVWQGPSGTLAVAWSPDGNLLATGGEDGQVRVYSPPQIEPRVQFRAPAPWVTALAWDPRGTTLVVAAGKTVSWWAPATGQALGTWNQAPSTVADLHWVPGLPLAACGYGGAWVFGQPGAPPTRTLAWKGSSLKVRCSPNKKWIATADQDKTVHVWPWPVGGDLMMGSFDAKSLDLLWTPSGSHLATSGSSTLLLWDCRGKGPGGRRPQMGRVQTGIITALDGSSHWATADDEGGLTVWDQELGVVTRQDLGRPGGTVRWITEDSVAVGASDGTVGLFDLRP